MKRSILPDKLETKLDDNLLNFFKKAKDGSIRMIKVIINDKKELELDTYKETGETSTDWAHDYNNLVLSSVDPQKPCFIFYRFDERAMSGYMWLFILWSPTCVPNKTRTYYALTKSTLINKFNSAGQIKEKLFATNLDEISLEGYLSYANTSSPISEREKEIIVLDENENEARIQPESRYKTMPSIVLDKDKLAIDKLNEFKNEQVDYVQLSIDIIKQKILLETYKQHLKPNELPNEIPKDKGRFHLFRFIHDHEGANYKSIIFIYSIPGFGCSVKERMLYSSSKSELLKFFKLNLNLEITKTLEISESSDLSYDYLIDELYPKRDDYFVTPIAKSSRKSSINSSTSGKSRLRSNTNEELLIEEIISKITQENMNKMNLINSAAYSPPESPISISDNQQHELAQSFNQTSDDESNSKNVNELINSFKEELEETFKEIIKPQAINENQTTQQQQQQHNPNDVENVNIETDEEKASINDETEENTKVDEENYIKEESESKEQEELEISKHENDILENTNTNNSLIDESSIFSFDQVALDKLDEFKREKCNYIQFSIDIKGERILLDKAKDHLNVDELESQVPTDKGRFHLFRFVHKHDNENFKSIIFIYSMPGFVCTVKERMLYSSCKSELLQYLKSQAHLDIAKTFEISEPNEINQSIILRDLSPNQSSSSSSSPSKTQSNSDYYISKLLNSKMFYVLTCGVLIISIGIAGFKLISHKS